MLIFSLTIGRRGLEFKIEQDIGNLKGQFEHTVHVIPKNQREILEDFDQRLYKEYKNSSICPIWEDSDWDDYDLEWNEEMTGKNFVPVLIRPKQHKELLHKINTIYKKEYEKIKNEIIATYDHNVAIFKKLYNETFLEQPINYEEIIPNKEEYENSFELIHSDLEYDLNANEQILERIKRFNL